MYLFSNFSNINENILINTGRKVSKYNAKIIEKQFYNR